MDYRKWGVSERCVVFLISYVFSLKQAENPVPKRKILFAREPTDHFNLSVLRDEVVVLGSWPARSLAGIIVRARNSSTTDITAMSQQRSWSATCSAERSRPLVAGLAVFVLIHWRSRELLERARARDSKEEKPRALIVSAPLCYVSRIFFQVSLQRLFILLLLNNALTSANPTGPRKPCHRSAPCCTLQPSIPAACLHL
jgi:hypothetical protein